MHNWTIGKRITIGFALLITISGLVGIFACLKLSQVSAKMDDLTTNWLPSLVELGGAEQEARITARNLLEDIVTEDPVESKRLSELLTSGVSALDARLGKYQSMVSTAVGEGPLYAKTTSTFAAYKTTLLSTQALLNAGKDKEAGEAYIRETRPALNAFLAAIKEEVDFNQTHSVTAAAEANDHARSTFVGVVLGAILSLVSGTVVAIVIIRGTKEALTRVSVVLENGANEIAAAAGQVSSSSQTLAEATSEQAASLEETSSSIEELSSMTKKNAENATTAQGLSTQTRAAAETGAARTAEMQVEMEAIQAASEEMRQAMGDIKASSDSVGKIIKTIDEIAFQTNILALNAAVEAARAGEAGAGFAVVAEEVRSLAQRSAEAAKETARMIESSVAQSERGVEVNAKVTERISGIARKSAGVRTSLDEIVERVRQVDSLVSEISGASKEQASGIEQITVAMTQMDKITQSNAAAAEETASASEELDAQAGELRNSVETLLQLVNGGENARPAAALPDRASQPRVEAVKRRTIPQLTAPRPRSGAKSFQAHLQ